jgi:hypothetical protein
MNRAIVVEEETLEREIEKAEQTLERFRISSNSPPISIHKELDKQTRNHGDSYSSRADSKTTFTVETLERALASFKSIEKEIKSKDIFSHQSEENKDILTNIYSLYGGTLSALKQISRISHNGEKNIKNIDLNFGSTTLGEDLIRIFYTGVAEKYQVKSGQKLADIAKRYYDKALDIAVSEFENNPSFGDKERSVQLQLGSLTIQGIKHHYIEPEEDKDSDTNFENLIAVDKCAKEMKNLAKRLFFYHKAHKSGDERARRKRKNMKRLALIYGLPGTGKSSIIDATINYMTKFSEESGIPFKDVEISNAVKSSMYSESVNNLRAKFEEAGSFEGVCLLWSDEADFIYSKDPVSSINQTDKEFVAEAQKMVQGVNTNMKNSIYLLSTNNKDNFYPPLFDRIENKYLIEGPKTAEEHQKLLDILTEDEVKEGNLSFDSYKIGKICEEYNFRGRDTFFLVKEIISKTEEDVELDAATLKDLDGDKILDYMIDQAKKLEHEQIEQMVRHYASERKS